MPGIGDHKSVTQGTVNSLPEEHNPVGLEAVKNNKQTNRVVCQCIRLVFARYPVRFPAGVCPAPPVACRGAYVSLRNIHVCPALYFTVDTASLISRLTNNSFQSNSML